VVAAYAVGRLPPRWAAVAVLAGCFILLGVALHAPPDSSNDWVRYAWDGRVQLHGIDPYRYAPDSPALAGLRAGFVHTSAVCGVPRPATSCYLVARVGVPTIYPPVAQALFTTVEAAAGQTARPRPFQILGAVAVVSVTAVLLRRSSTPAAAALWAWCPLPVIQYANNAHIDAVGILFGILGLTAAARRHTRTAPVSGRGAVHPKRPRPWAAVLAAGGWVGAGAATKVFPVLLLPSLTGARPARLVRAAGAAAAVVGLSYLPHLLAVGPAVAGYLPGYLHEEGYVDGQRFHVLAWFVHGSPATVVAGVLLVVAAVAVAVTTDPAHPERSAVLLVGVFLLVTTPTYPWYGGLLVAVAALADRPRWIVVALAAVPTYGAASLGSTIDTTGRLAYTAAAAVVIAVPLLRSLAGRARPVAAGH